MLLLLPLLLIPLMLFLLKQITQAPTQEQIAQQTYEKAKKQADSLSKTVADQTDVPQNETPNVATITDVTKLQSQEFFKQAQNGDKLLIYEKNKLIVLYRPSKKRVIATAPVLYNQPEKMVAGTESAVTSPSISVPQ